MSLVIARRLISLVIARRAATWQSMQFEFMDRHAALAMTTNTTLRSR